MAHPQIPRTRIESIDFTLYYDYDQLRYRKLSRLTDDGKIQWFRHRMNFVFLEPLRRLYDVDSIAFRALNSTKKRGLPARSFVIPTFAVLLNGIEALGSFLTPPRNPAKSRDYNRLNFFAFMSTYMKTWDKTEPKAPYATKDVKDILWTHFRNGIAHGFRIEGGGIDNEADAMRWRVVNRRFQVGPNRFFSDFALGTESFFKDTPTIHRVTFLRRFGEVYPH